MGMVSLTACSNKNYLDVEYEVESLKGYNKLLKESTVTAKLSENTVLALEEYSKIIAYSVEDALVVSSGKVSSDDLEELTASGILVVYTKDIKDVVAVDDMTSDEVVLAIKNNDFIKKSNVIIPCLDSIREKFELVGFEDNTIMTLYAKAGAE